ncbi:MAG TPA: hypothetical protein VFK48_15135 [Usitatibacter sp.]|nr:hypothetical protein [Usitatibacter sp.]
MLLLTTVSCFVFVGWMVARIWKRNAVLAIVTLFVWPLTVFAVMRYWGDEYSDIKVPFLLFASSLAYTCCA